MEMERLEDKQLIEDFLKDCKTRRMSAHTIESYHSSLNLLQKFISKKGYGFVELDRRICTDYIDYLNEQGMSFSTMKNRFSTYNSFYDYLKYEDYLKENIVKEVCKRYLSKYKENNVGKRKIISIEDMARFINMIPDIRDKAIVLLFAKTGIRRRELVSLDIDDINWENMSITLKPTNKRSNRVVYFDYETANILKRWIRKREMITDSQNKALFTSYTNKKKRLNRNGVGYIFVKWAEIAGLHDSSSDEIENHFTPHCCRHWYTTYLSNGGEGMPREYIKELRGDVNKDAMDIYNHIDHEKLRRSYLSHIPQLGII
jgi:integrase/recombinase XerD